MIGICFSALYQFRHMDMDWSGWGWFWMAFMMIIVAIAVIVVVFLLVRPSYGNREIEKKTGESPLDIAKRRYAAGEITADEFDKMKRDLE